MVRKSFTAVLEKNATFSSHFATEPYEAGWATEARWFIRILDLSGSKTNLHLYAQVSPDGLIWCDEGTSLCEITAPGLYTFAMKEFGGWLRLRGELEGHKQQIKTMIYLSLKG